MRPRARRKSPTIPSWGTAAALLLASLAPGSAPAAEAGADWPSWRGPDGNGVSPTADPPLSWSEEENVRWKVKLPGAGSASPVVWGDRVFVLAAVPVDAAEYEENREEAGDRDWPPNVEPAAQRFVVMALSRKDGSVLWERTAIEAVPHESHHVDSTFASASPVTDGEVLLAYFGSRGLFAYDLDGEPLWQVDLGDMTTRHAFGEGSTPALHGDRVIVNWDHEGDSFVVALDKRSGRELWRTARPGEATSWATPLVVERPGGAQVVIPATGHSRGYELETGEELWRLSGMTVNVIPSAVHRDGVVYLTSGFRGNMLQAVALDSARGDLNSRGDLDSRGDPDSRGDLGGSPAVLWTYDRDTPYVPSPLLYGDQLYIVKHFANILTSLDAATGEVLFGPQRIEGIDNIYASPVGAAGRVYLVGRQGDAVVLEHGPGYRPLAHNRLDDRFDATPALVDGEIYLRGREHLYCIARDPEPAAGDGR